MLKRTKNKTPKEPTGVSFFDAGVAKIQRTSYVPRGMDLVTATQGYNKPEVLFTVPAGTVTTDDSVVVTVEIFRAGDYK